MRIALIADIHGNLVALDAVLAEIAAEGIEHVVCLGDITMGGAQPEGVVDRLRALGCPVVLGNADDLALDPSRIPIPDGSWAWQAEIDRWSAAQLSDEACGYIRSFPPTVGVDLGDGATLLCYHGSPRSYNDPILPTTPDDDLRRMLGGSAALIFAGGHTHQQMFRRFGHRIVVNPGSIGMAFDPPDLAETLVLAAPWAEYAVLHHAGGQLRVDLRRVPFDVEAVVRAGLISGMPHAAWWAERRRPPLPEGSALAELRQGRAQSTTIPPLCAT